MIIENINNLKITLRKQETQSICIIDNNFISFLLKLKPELDISYKKKDGSIEEEKQLMNNEEFKQFLQKEDVYLIF